MKSYFEQWEEMWANESGAGDSSARVATYYELETEAYRTILEQKQANWSGTFAELARQLGFAEDKVIFAGFLDGINQSLREPLQLENLEDDSPLQLEIDFEKLYWNMREVKADWLYDLPEWEQVLPEARRDELTREFRQSKIARVEKIGRNEPCPCGSGKKYKKCCGAGGVS